MQYKIDWLAFSVSLENYDLEKEIIRLLKYDIKEFTEIPARFFYNSGMTFYNFINIFYNDKKKKLHTNSSNTMTVVFTGQGCTDLAEKFDEDWLEIFELLTMYNKKISFTRIDIALDDFDKTVSFDDIEKKLKKGHYRSSKESYNIVKTSDVNGKTLGQTIYIGNARAASGSRGNVYARFYDKKAQYEAKNQILLEQAQESWQRYEISYSKKYANSVVEQYLKIKNIDKIFKTTLRDLLELLTPRPNNKNKSRWFKTRFWQDFLRYDEKIDFGISERDVMLADLLNWLQTAVLPSLALLEKIGNERGFDIYELLRIAEKNKGFSKKQNRLYLNSQTISDELLNDYLSNFIKKQEQIKGD